ncbi:MAG: glycosyltransferase family 2 protein, partial [Candidatus Omnitrophica bacterium]|nr:glycosyltransferase family 2 protein [Candidatus Omnitrophota bacterium]
MNKVSILILTHSEIGSFKNCLQEIIWHNTRQKDYEWEILVLLNGVEESLKQKYYEFKKFYEKKFNNIKFFESDKNLNFSKANNFLSKYAKGDYLLLINDDVILVNKVNTIKEMLDCFKRYENVGVVGARLIYPNDKIQHAGVGFTENKPQHLWWGFNDLHPSVMKEREFQAVTFALAMIKKDVWEKLGGLLEPEKDDFEYYYEDIDFCLRARELGYKIFYCPNAVAIHYGSLTAKKVVNINEALKNLPNFMSKWKDKIKVDYYDFMNEKIPDDIPRILVAIPISEQNYWLKEFLLHNLLSLYYCRDLLTIFFIINNSGIRFINELREWALFYGKMFDLKVVFPDEILFENDKNKIIVETRNLAIKKAEELNMTHIFFWDADVYIPYDTLLKLTKINDDKYPITSGLVPYKDDFNRWMAFKIRDDVKNLNEFEERLKQMSD